MSLILVEQDEVTQIKSIKEIYFRGAHEHCIRDPSSPSLKYMHFDDGFWGIDDVLFNPNTDILHIPNTSVLMDRYVNHLGLNIIPYEHLKVLVIEDRAAFFDASKIVTLVPDLQTLIFAWNLPYGENEEWEFFTKVEDQLIIELAGVRQCPRILLRGNTALQRGFGNGEFFDDIELEMLAI